MSGAVLSQRWDLGLRKEDLTSTPMMISMVSPAFLEKYSPSVSRMPIASAASGLMATSE